MHLLSLKTTLFVVFVFALLSSLRVSGSDIWKREPQNPQPTSVSSQANTSPASPTSSGTSTSVPDPPDPNSPAILVQMTEPASAKNILYKIGSNITFGWKYSGDFASGYAPKSINVFAQSSLDQNNYYTIAANATGNTTKVIWITATESSLPMATYRLYICDERGLTGVPMPGALSVFSGLQFGMYTPRGRTDLPAVLLARERT
ncbi:17907_t:CDS:2 [Acaulospora morrowiae]|uniref:17907_t:CDS:1 n=1 Tax=Acaulospora morrowiae TaxID=94023 RepID=A0A9N9EHP6_9GLOM|nr:17907_t:CDS:2 [Acaulospora morrowiae]